MICPHDLTEREQEVSQKVYRNYIALGALAGSCSNMTIQVLLAVQLGISTAAISCIGSLEYLKYLILPLGFLLTRRYGACGTMRLIAYVIASACCLLAVSAVIPFGAFFLFFAAIILMYAGTACNASMSFPLQKNITTDLTLPRMISRNQIASSCVSLTANLAIAGLFAYCTGTLVIPALFCAAAVFYFFNGHQIMRMPEPSIIKELSRRPILPQVREAWQDKLIRKQLVVGFVLNQVFITMIPVNLLAVKKGCEASNMTVLLLTTIQLLFMIPASRWYRYVTEHFGPRKMMILTCPVVWTLAAYWYFVPVEKSFFLMIIPFILASLITVGFSSAMGNYFIIAAPNHLQVGGSVLIFLIHGGLVGIVGIVANPLLFKLIGTYMPVNSMDSFRLYYLITGLISLTFIFAPVSLPVKYLEYRAKQAAKQQRKEPEP